MTKGPFARRDQHWVGRLWAPCDWSIGVTAALTIVCFCAVAFAQEPSKSEAGPKPDNLSLPRYASLKSDRVNLRNGPGTDYPTSWVFRRAGLPVEITKEFEIWRQVRDADGTSGWVLQSLLSGRRTALVLPWDLKPGMTPTRTSLFLSDSPTSRTVAVIEAGVIANVQGCDGKWCRVNVGNYSGYIEQLKLWGVYPNETVR